MYISRVEIENFRNFSHLDVQLGITAVIVGENQVGKSNFLQALRLVLDPTLPDSNRQLTLDDFWEGCPDPLSGSAIRVAIELTGFAESLDGKAALASCIVGQDPLTARLTYVYRARQVPNQATVHRAVDNYEFLTFGGLDENERVGTEVRRWVSLMLLPALRDAEGDLQSWGRSPLRPLLERLAIDSSRLQEIAAALESVSGQLVAEEPMRRLSEAITSRIEGMVGSALGVETRLGFASTQPDHLLRAVRLFVDGERSRPLQTASLGSANIIFLALLLQELEGRVEAREAVTHIVAIEEPEAHLHPHVQRALFRHFLRGTSPVIVSTHSPHVASVSPLSALVMLKRSAQDGTQAYATRALALSDVEFLDLERYLDVSRAELLFAKGVLLVEGIAEAFLVPRFAVGLANQEDQFASPLDNAGISVCPVNGTDFRPFTRLLTFLHIPHAVVTDGDRGLSSNGMTHYLGLRRGVVLVEGDQAWSAEQSSRLASGNWDGVRLSLAEHDIFVGEQTLELDLLPQAAEAMKLCYADLIPSARSVAGFTQAVNLAVIGDRDAEQLVLRYIDDVGKGRFAQRLSLRVSEDLAPAYIRSAIESLSKRVNVLG